MNSLLKNICFGINYVLVFKLRKTFFGNHQNDLVWTQFMLPLFSLIFTLLLKITYVKKYFDCYRSSDYLRQLTKPGDLF